jgi:hypothetical protein
MASQCVPQSGDYVILHHQGAKRLGLVISGMPRPGDPLQGLLVWDGQQAWWSTMRAGALADVPECVTCQGTIFWWTELGDSKCAQCEPPLTPRWDEQWAKAQAVLASRADDPPRSSIAQSVQGLTAQLDAAFLAHDYPSFQRALVILTVLDFAARRDEHNA